MDVVMTQKRTHRVGAITAGASLVGFGIVFLLQQFMALDFVFIIKFWPLVLIGLGAQYQKGNGNRRDRGKAHYAVALNGFSCLTDKIFFTAQTHTRILRSFHREQFYRALWL